MVVRRRIRLVQLRRIRIYVAVTSNNEVATVCVQIRVNSSQANSSRTMIRTRVRS